MIIFARNSFDIMTFLTTFVCYMSYGSVGNITENPISEITVITHIVCVILFLTYCIAGNSTDSDFGMYLFFKVMLYLITLFIITVLYFLMAIKSDLFAVFLVVVSCSFDAFVYGAG